MSAPATIPRQRLISLLRDLGFEGPEGSRHDFMKRDSFKLHIPNQHGSRSGGQSVPLSVAKKVLSQAGLSDDEIKTSLGLT